jgi:hypothetical protein
MRGTCTATEPTTPEPFAVDVTWCARRVLDAEGR